MKIQRRLYVINLTVACLLFVPGCSTKKTFSHTWQSPVDYVYSDSGRPETLAVEKIKEFTKYIDSLSENDEFQELVTISIAEGDITQERITTSITGHGNKIDTIRKTKFGGFGKYTTQNKKRDTVYKIHYHDNIDKNFYETYYYKDNKLVCSQIEYKEDGGEHTFYFREEFYVDNKVLLINESKKPSEAVHRQRITFDQRKKGYEYFEIFLSDRK